MSQWKGREKHKLMTEFKCTYTTGYTPGPKMENEKTHWSVETKVYSRRPLIVISSVD